MYNFIFFYTLESMVLGRAVAKGEAKIDYDWDARFERARKLSY